MTAWTVGVPSAQGIAGSEWTTTLAPRDEQLDMWRDAVDRAFVPVSVDRPAGREQDSGFASELAVRNLGPVQLAHFSSDAQSVRRTTDQVRRGTRGLYFVNLPLTANTCARQHGQDAHLAAGDFVLVDGDRPFDLEFANPFRQISLTIPADLLHRRLEAPDEATGVRLAGDQGVAAVASAAIRAAATTTPFDQASARALGEQLCDLIALALGGLRPTASRSSGALLWRTVLDHTDRGLGDPNLSPAVVAHRVGISTRYLHRLFAAHGPSFGQWVRERRLQRARRALAGYPAPTIAEVAAASGFGDPAYFARAYKARFGITPSQARTIHHAPERSAPPS